MQVATERAPWRPSACAEVAAHIIAADTFFADLEKDLHSA